MISVDQVIGNGHSSPASNDLFSEQVLASEGGELRAPPRTGRWVALVAVGNGHLEFLYQLATNENNGFRWLLTGVVPPPDVFFQNLWKGVLTQFVVVERRSSNVIGVVVAYNAEIQHGFSYLGAAFVPQVENTGLGIEAVELFVHYLFGTYNFRKLYLDVPEYNMHSMVHLGQGLLKCEGRLQKHTYYSGRYWDRYTLAIYRDEVAAAPLHRSGRRRR